MLGSGSFLSTVVRSEVAGRSAGIDCRRGFAPIDRSISVDSRAVFCSLIHAGKLLRCPKPAKRNENSLSLEWHDFMHPSGFTWLQWLAFLCSGRGLKSASAYGLQLI